MPFLLLAIAAAGQLSPPAPPTSSLTPVARLEAYLSEPFNTATSAAYPLCAGYAWRLHHRLSLSRWHRLMLSVTMAMGIGSMIFHGTLRYWAQLLDELPLYAMAVLAAATLRQRASRAPGVQPLAAVAEPCLRTHTREMAWPMIV